MGGVILICTQVKQRLIVNSASMSLLLRMALVQYRNISCQAYHQASIMQPWSRRMSHTHLSTFRLGILARLHTWRTSSNDLLNGAKVWNSLVPFVLTNP